LSAAKKIAKEALLSGYRTFIRFFGSFADRRYLDPKVPISKLAGHSNYLEYLTNIGNRKGIRILEVGSR
jgi:hypothetical protein